MSTHLLILGGTTQASALARAVAEAGILATFSYAGRVDSPKTQPIPQRIGGFGGVEGLVAYLREHSITHVVDATHPFAARMSWNAFHACAEAEVGLMALTRPAWTAEAGDQWTHVPDIEGAVAALEGMPKRIMLALGRMHVEDFTAQPQHHYVLRLVDAPSVAPSLPNHRVVVARGPFDVAGDIALFKDHAVDIVVCKNAGGIGAEAKIHAARALGLPVVMIDRPALPARAEVATVEAVLEWLGPVA